VRRMAGSHERVPGTLLARIPRRMAMERGRTEYLLVTLVEGPPALGGGTGYVAYPMGKGSGSVTAFARADGFVRLPGHVEFLDANESVTVTLLGRDVKPADLVVIGSHCIGLDTILTHVARAGWQSKTIFVGSTAGLESAGRGECDIAPIHLLDAASGRYNEPFVPPGTLLVPGYRRRQGVCFRPGDRHFAGRSLPDAVASALADPTCRIESRNRGSGTRVLIDRLLAGATPPGLASESRSHHGVAAAVAQGRADWGVCLEGVARDAGLSTVFVAEESYDFLVPAARAARPAVRAFVAALAESSVRDRLRTLGFAPS
jgi:putative molybdopterin biosynthesis protein